MPKIPPEKGQLDAGNRERQATYRIYSYEDGRISYRTQYMKSGGRDHSLTDY